MKINGYEVDIVCANYDPRIGGYGDIYDELDECLKDHPECKIMWGFHIRDDSMPTPDWFPTIEDVIHWISNHG